MTKPDYECYCGHAHSLHVPPFGSCTAISGGCDCRRYSRHRPAQNPVTPMAVGADDREVAEHEKPRCDSVLTANSGQFGWTNARCEYVSGHRGLHYHGKAYWGTEGRFMQDLDEYRQQLATPPAQNPVTPMVVGADDREATPAQQPVVTDIDTAAIRAHGSLRPSEVRALCDALDAARAEIERLANERQEEALLRIGAEAMVEALREERDAARAERDARMRVIELQREAVTAATARAEQAEAALHDMAEELMAAQDTIAGVRRALDDELANLADDGARLSHSVVRRIEAILAEHDCV